MVHVKETCECEGKRNVLSQKQVCLYENGKNAESKLRNKNPAIEYQIRNS